MRTLTRTQRQAAAVAAVLCASALPAGASGLYSVNAGFHVEAPFFGSGPANGHQFGTAVAAADFDGDGVPDLATGIPGDDTLGSNAGLVQVRYGATGKGLNGSVSRIGTPPDKNAGLALASGDFNGDGGDDLAVAGDDGEGYVRIYYGGAGGLPGTSATRYDSHTSGIGGDDCPFPGACYEDSSRYAGLGTALAAGDFDADGFDDLVIGQGDYRAGFDDHAGRIIVIYGTASGLSTAGMRKFTQGYVGMDGDEQTNDYFGAALASGDFNNDGFEH